MKLKLKKSSWENLFESIRREPPKNPQGNFWAAIQYLEEQMNFVPKINTIEERRNKVKSEVFELIKKLTNKKETIYGTVLYKKLTIASTTLSDTLNILEKEGKIKRKRQGRLIIIELVN